MIIPIGFAQVNYVFSGASCPSGAEVTFGLSIDLVGTPTPDAVALEARTIWDAQLKSITNTSVTLSKVKVKFGPNDVGASTELLTNIAGTGGGSSVSPNVAFLWKKQTALGGRRGRGRWYYPGVNEGQVDASGNILAADITAINLKLTNFLDDWSTFGADPVLLHAAGKSSTPVPTAWIGFACDTKVATQRRRNRR